MIEHHDRVSANLRWLNVRDVQGGIGRICDVFIAEPPLIEERSDAVGGNAEYDIAESNVGARRGLAGDLRGLAKHSAHGAGCWKSGKPACRVISENRLLAGCRS